MTCCTRFYPLDATLARVLAVCLSVCLSASVCLSQVGVLSKQMDESNWFWRGTSFHLSYTVLKGNSSNFRNKGTSFWNFVPESGLWKILPRHIDCRNVIDLARHGGRSERDKRDLRRSAKLTIPPSSDARSIAGDRQALSTARDCRTGQLATADTCLERCLQQR